jgi:hypothetical protein
MASNNRNSVPRKNLLLAQEEKLRRSRQINSRGRIVKTRRNHNSTEAAFCRWYKHFGQSDPPCPVRFVVRHSPFPAPIKPRPPSAKKRQTAITLQQDPATSRIQSILAQTPSTSDPTNLLHAKTRSLYARGFAARLAHAKPRVSTGTKEIVTPRSFSSAAPACRSSVISRNAVRLCRECADLHRISPHLLGASDIDCTRSGNCLSPPKRPVCQRGRWHRGGALFPHSTSRETYRFLAAAPRGTRTRRIQCLMQKFRAFCPGPCLPAMEFALAL